MFCRFYDALGRWDPRPVLLSALLFFILDAGKSNPLLAACPTTEANSITGPTLPGKDKVPEPLVAPMVGRVLPGSLGQVPVKPVVQPVVVDAMTPSKVYEGQPFSAGERVSYLASYFSGVKVGIFTFNVLAPELKNGFWHMIFAVEAKSGDWYKSIVEANYKAKAWTLPKTFVASGFTLYEDLNPLIGSSYFQEKWLEFDHENCKALERIQHKKDPLKEESFDLDPEATDILGAIYKLRTFPYTLNKEERFKVYTSGKTWWLSATPEAFVRLDVPLGTFDAVRLNLQTYIGKDLEQKGDVRVWVAFNHPQRPILKFKFDVKIGHFVLALQEFVSGK
ncbi:MAG: DUF3108 domain-containing protein [Oligoflexales bacterium]|nr:DUF3108 domain-containing protein [Oligoflexales bacterium]